MPPVNTQNSSLASPCNLWFLYILDPAKTKPPPQPVWTRPVLDAGFLSGELESRCKERGPRCWSPAAVSPSQSNFDALNCPWSAKCAQSVRDGS